MGFGTRLAVLLGMSWDVGDGRALRDCRGVWDTACRVRTDLGVGGSGGLGIGEVDRAGGDFDDRSFAAFPDSVAPDAAVNNVGAVENGDHGVHGVGIATELSLDAFSDGVCNGVRDGICAFGHVVFLRFLVFVRNQKN